MRTQRAGLVLASVALALIDCSGPSASGTKTNWFQECDIDADCGQVLSCTCGLCTSTCTEDTECGEGHCGEELETSSVCGATGPARICLLPTQSGCFEVELTPNGDLGAAVTPNCEVAGALVCETFDRPLPDEYSTWFQDAMSATIQDCDVRGGSGALRYFSEAPGQAQTRIRLPTPLDTGTLYVRLSIKLSGETTLPEQLQFFELWDREESEVPDRTTIFLDAEGVPKVYVGVSATTLQAVDSRPLPRDTWMCMELALDILDEDGSVELRIDGQQVFSGEGFATRPEQPISVVVVEAQPSTDTDGVELFVDDLIVATSPIGCP